MCISLYNNSARIFKKLLIRALENIFHLKSSERHELYHVDVLFLVFKIKNYLKPTYPRPYAYLQSDGIGRFQTATRNLMEKGEVQTAP